MSKAADARIYRDAAEHLLARPHGYYGMALDRVGQPNPGGDDSPLQAAFEALFPEADNLYKNDWLTDWSQETALALCLMANIVESA